MPLDAANLDMGGAKKKKKKGTRLGEVQTHEAQ